MTPNVNIIETACDDAPEDFKNKLKCAIMELSEKECTSILISLTHKGDNLWI